MPAIIKGKQAGATLAVFDPRLSNTAAVADYWLLTWPGSEAAVLLAIARILIREGMIDREFVRRWTNWRQGGVHQNLTFPVHPDPVSGMHCWHQRVTVTRAQPGDRYGDVVADTAAAMRVYREWLARTRPAPGPDGSRRPGWLLRAVKPAAAAYQLPLP